MATTPVVYDSASKRHRPLAQSESLPAASVPISAVADNIVELRPDGLYARSLRDAESAAKDGAGNVITDTYERIDDLVTNTQIDAMFA